MTDITMLAPTAPGFPWIGNAIDLLDDPLAFFLKSYLTLGPVFRAGAFGRTYTVLAGPDANAFLYRGGAERYLDSGPVYQHISEELDAPSYLIATVGERHDELRRTFRPAMSPEVFEGRVPEMVARVAQIARGWRREQTLDVLSTMRELLAEVVGLALFGRKLGDLLPDAIRFARFSIGSGLGGYPNVARYAPFYLLSKRRMLAFFREALDEHRRTPPGDTRSADVFDLLLAAREPDGKPFSDEDIIANAQLVYSNTLLYAGPSSAFMLYGLLKHPAARDAVLAELDGAAMSGPLELKVLRGLPALMGSMLESFRMHPIGLATPRLVAESFEFAGRHVLRGERLLIAVTVCHYLPQVFPEPYKFDIGRYLPPCSEQRQPGMLVPFGMGGRSCLAQRLVEALMLVVVGGLISASDLDLDPPDYQLRKRVNPFSEPRSGFKMRVREPVRRSRAVEPRACAS
jgi:cytochrome P450